MTTEITPIMQTDVPNADLLQIPIDAKRVSADYEQMASHDDGDVQLSNGLSSHKETPFRTQVLTMNPFRTAVIAFVKQYIEAHSVQYSGVATVTVSGRKRSVHLDGMWRIGTNTGGLRAKCTVMEG